MPKHHNLPNVLPKDPEFPERLLRQPEVEKLLGLSASCLEQWRLSGRGPRWCRLGRSVRYKLSDIKEFCQNLKAYRSTTEADQDNAA